MTKEIEYYDSNTNKLKSGFYRHEDAEKDSSLLFVEMAKEPFAIDLLDGNAKIKIVTKLGDATRKGVCLSMDLTPANPLKILKYYEKQSELYKKRHSRLKKLTEKYSSRLEELTA